MVTLVKHDLEFILKQIEIAEAHADGGDLAALVAGYGGNDGLAQAHLLPYGLRTVDGSYNNLLPGRENWGASDQSFPGLFTPTYLNDGDGDSYSFNPAPGAPPYSNNNYGTSATVIDADPRIISNLIVDQTLNNPAAIAAALTLAGVPAAELYEILGQIVDAKRAVDAATTGNASAQQIANLEAAVDAAEAALAQANADAGSLIAAAAGDQALLTAAEDARDAAQLAAAQAVAAVTALLIDGVPNADQSVAFANAIAHSDLMQAAVVTAEANLVTAQANAAASSAALSAVIGAAADALTEAQADLAAALQSAPDLAAAQAHLTVLLAAHGVEMDGNTVLLPNVSPDEGLSSPFNGWMTIFGQFFDHGLDLVAKGGNGTVYVPLAVDDPLYEVGGQNYIAVTRVTVNPGADGILGTADDGAGPKNLTTPWVDQNQTYASTASKQVFMREYIDGPDGKPIASGLLLEGLKGGLATWADIKAQARDVLGIDLTDLNVGNIPLIAADEYGNFIPGPNGYPQLVVGWGPDGILGTIDDVLREGNPGAPVSALGVVLTGHAFLDDIAHAAVPVAAGGVLQEDPDSLTGNTVPSVMGRNTQYDDELLDRHFIAGDGRVNENIALTAVHQVFHAEHNRIVEMTKQIALESGDLNFLNQWLRVDVTAIPTTQAGINALVWDGERLFQAGRFTNEMEYQHLVFEEFGRMMQPDIDAFVFEPSADINPSIAAEFAHVVYRFGHSMLRQNIDVIQMDAVTGNPIENEISLFSGFLNPVMYESLGTTAEEASGAIIRGMTRQVGSAIDEFVTDVLRNQLLGIPLDLAAINLARGRDVGTPPLNVGRQKFYDETGDTLLKPYTSWADFALNLMNPASIINFIAAYGTHESLLNTQANPKTVEQLREAATLLVLGGTGAPADRLDFLNATGAYANAKLGGLNDVDFWIGGLAEKKMAFGGMLGSTFAFVFQMTMENLQDADRFYYLSRTQGLNLLNELENNTFAELVMRNTDLGGTDQTALPGNLFSAFEMPTLEMDPSKQLGDDPTQDNPYLPFANIVERRDAAGNLIAAGDTSTIAAYIRVNSNEHFTIGGTEGNDTIVSGGGDDAIWGKGGNDRIEAGYGVDKVFGGTGDDIITNAGTDIGEADFLHGNEGNDVIHGGSGLSLIFGNQGSDFLIAGPDGKEVFAGTGNDFVLGGTGGDFLLGNEGDDWIEGGDRFDTLAGENSELFFNSSIIGHDVLLGGGGDTDYDGESGDDIMSQNSEGIQRSNGMAGFDWAIHKGDSQAANSDLGIPIFETQEAFILRDRFDLVEGLSGWVKDDTLTGRNVAVNTRAEAEGTAAIPNADSALDSYSNALLEKNVDLITGLRALVAHITRTQQTGNNEVVESVVLETADASDILLGGGGSDTIKGLAGNDVIDGDMWLNVRIAGTSKAGTVFSADAMESAVTLYRHATTGDFVALAGANIVAVTKPLTTWMLEGAINPGALRIVREIINGNVAGDIDRAVYTDARANYSFGLNSDDSLFIDHTGFVQVQNDDDLPEQEEGTPNLRSDGKDTFRNIELLAFSDGRFLNVIEGTSAGETLTGTLVNTGTGLDDLISGRDGNDTLNGGAGDDILLGGDGADTLNGGDGNDTLVGGTGADALNGGSGNDTYVVNLGDGNDIITDANGTDRIVIGAGTLTGLTAFSGGSNDLFLQFNGQQLTVNDHYDAAAEAVETINLDGATYEGYAFDGDYALSTDDNGNRTAAAGVNTLLAGSGNGNELVGDTGDDLLFGHDGNDELFGNDGDDLLVGGTGSDELDGGTGADTMVGGTGNDIYTVDDTDDVVVEALGGGTDEVRTDLDTYTLGANVDNLTYIGAGTFAGIGNELANVIEGGAGVDTLTGLGGNDTYVVTAGDVVVEAANGGTDTIIATATYTLGANLENLTLDEDAGGINGTGNALDNVITGNDAANQLFGGGGNDTINGGDGADFIDGGTGNDILHGGGGNDTDILIGGEGDDTIHLGAGNNGNDIVRYTATNFGNDTIHGFDASGGSINNQDMIDLSALGVTAANFATRVTIEDVEDAGTDDTRVTVRDASNTVIGTIFIEEVDGNDVTSADFILAQSAPATVGNPTNGANTITGNDQANTINGLGGNDTLSGGGGNDIITGGEGADTLNGDAGDDTIIWNANVSGPTDGRDTVNGGTEGTAGDTFVVNGNALAETYRIYTKAAATTAGFVSAALTEIVITRQVGAAPATVIAELREIEEIRINGIDPAGNTTASGDTIQIFGDFSTTSLRLNTITIEGDAGDDTVDISALSSAHRIVFRSNGGHDTIIGTLRPEDVIELPIGADPAEYTSSTTDGVTTLTNGQHSISYVATGEGPQIGGDDDEDDEDEDDHEDDDHEDDDCDDDDDDDDASSAGGPVLGTPQDDVLLGTSGGDLVFGFAGTDYIIANAGVDVIRAGAGDDFVDAGAGRDVVFADDGDDDVFGGDDDDLIYGEAGDDRLFGGSGNDLIDAGADDDTVFGGAGNDLFVGSLNDGNDTYYGGEISGDAGNDTLDLAFLTADATVDLGTGVGGRGSAVSSQSGTDTLYGVENVTTGSGDDVITMSNAVNVVDGGAGEDIFVFGSATAAHGDTIKGFEAGDKIDLSGIDANAGVAGNNSFTLQTSTTAPGQIVVTHETREDGEYTVISGNTAGDNAPEFRISIAGNHALTGTDFNL
ncbi:peroxidase family protein [Devosia sp. LjRoot3]|uniref:peroxidase family protein n=1 Tax=Devosia sp. LjRoot3 TaxID=3342319 RepID=UPI003F4F8927